MRYCILYCCCLFCSLAAYCQYDIRHFTTENGLPSNGIKGMEWDEKTGFLWIATEAGLVRYNGMGFKTFDVNSNPEFGSSRIVTLTKNEGGKILMAGESGNLSIVKHNTASFYFKGGDAPKYNYNHYLALSASDTLFAKCFKRPWHHRFGFANTVFVCMSDTASIVLAEGQLYYYAVSTADPILVVSSPTGIKNLFKIGKQLYYLDIRNHLYEFDLNKNLHLAQEMIDEDGRAFVMQEANSHLFWQVGMDFPVLLQQGKAWIIEKNSDGKLRFRLIATGIPENALFKYVQYKNNGNYLFLGSDSKGLYIVRKNQLIVKRPDRLNINEKNSFYSQLELPDGNVITGDGKIIGDIVPKQNFDFGNFKRSTKSFIAINDSEFVVSRNDSAFLYNKYTYKKRLLFRHLLSENFSLTPAGGQLYFANQNGIGVVTKDTTIDFLKTFNKRTDVLLNVFVMLETSPGKLALATCEGLFGFDTKTNRLDTLLKIPSVCIRSLYKEGDYIFIGTYGAGFYIMKDGVIKAMPIDINQNLNYTHCFIKDNKGFCWISTNNGLFKAKMSDIIEAYERGLPEIYYHYLGKEDGMQTTEMNGGCTPCALRLKNGIFSFPTMDGLLWFNPEEVEIILPAGNIYIDKVLGDGKQWYNSINGFIQFGENVQKIDVSLTVDAWCRKENLYMDYKLNDDDWQRIELVADEPRIILNNVEHGKHVLRIRKLNGFGFNNYSSVTLMFSVATPFYHQWWFRVLGLIALVGIGYLIFKLRLRQYQVKEKKLSALVAQKTMDLNLKNIQLEKNNEVKTRLISVINHDIITPLKFMHYAGKALEENKGTIDRAEELQTITEITQTARDMEMLSSQILSWIIYQNPNERMQKEEFDLSILIEMVFRVLQFPAKLKNTSLRNEVVPHFVVYQYMEPLRVLIYNLVLNSINFTKTGSVTVQSKMCDGLVTIMVKDTGLGMTQDQIRNLMSDEKIIASANIDNKKGTGLGYMIIKDLLKWMDGSLSIESVKNKGTTVSVLLP